MSLSTSIDLNNKGVIHLDAEEYNKAAQCFREASKLVLLLCDNEIPASVSDITRVERTIQPLPSPLNLQSENNKPAQDEESSNVEKKSQKVSLAPTTTRKRARMESTEQPQKRVKREGESSSSTECMTTETARETSTTTNITVTTNARNTQKTSFGGVLLGRPLWMKQPPAGAKGFRVTTAAAVILYNFGLTFHLNAARAGPSMGLGLFRRALTFYSKAKDLVLGSPASHAFESPVLLVSLQNVASIYATLGSKEKYLSTTRQLGAVLRLLKRTSNRGSFISERGYEGFFLRLLSMPSANDAAAAA